MAAPTVFTTAESATTTAGTNHVVTLPSGIVANDLILICMDIGSTSATLNAHGSYTELLDESAANGLKILYRYATGGESNPTLVSSASTRDATITLRIGGARNPSFLLPAIATTATGTSANPDPPQSAAPGANGDYLAIAFFGSAGEEADDDTWVNSGPTNYLPAVPLQKACGTVGTNLGGLIGLSYRQFRGISGSAEDPTAFNMDVSAAWRAQTILVYSDIQTPDLPPLIMPSMGS
jgi:hypothetical protein